MHGHGEKPYLCKYEDCDRSITGNGFPRRWNLQDHMKRVHDDLGPSSTGSASPSPSSVSSTAPAKVTTSGRKKRASISAQDQPSKRPKSMTNTKSTSKSTKSQSAHSQGKQRHHVQRQWRDQHAPLNDRLDSLDPADVFGYKEIDEYAILQDLGKTVHLFGADHYTPLD